MSTGTFFSSGNLQADRRFEYALSYALQGEMEAAIELLGTITDMAPHWPAVPFMLGTWLVEQGLVSEAQGAFQQALSLDPIDRLGAAVKLRMITGDTSGDPLPAGYVKSLFDEYAPRFDAHLQNDYTAARKNLAEVLSGAEILPPSLTERARALDQVFAQKVSAVKKETTTSDAEG